jgi:CheY-like chemotaxis protein
MLSFARGGKVEVKPTDLNQVVRHAAEMFGRTRRELLFRESYEPSLWPVEVDRGQIDQLLVNLFVNAWQAMPTGGEIRLRTESVTLGPDQVAPHQLSPGPYVKLSVGDTGEGMTEAVRQRLFEPFFTTKEVGKGTGLGLASVYGIVQSHQGLIEVQSERGQGSTFEIFLPAGNRPLETQAPRSEEVPRGSETVLLVDDEPLVLNAEQRLLQRLGYRVIAAESGAAALAQVEAREDEIDLVLLDLTMPGLGGGEVFDKMRAIAPGLKVLLTSGYGTEGEVSAILERGCDGFVQKPFDLTEVATKLREALDRRSTGALATASLGSTSQGIVAPGKT